MKLFPNENRCSRIRDLTPDRPFLNYYANFPFRGGFLKCSSFVLSQFFCLKMLSYSK